MGVLDGSEKLASHFLLFGYLGKVEQVEASMSDWHRLGDGRLDDKFDCFHPVQRDPIASRQEQQELFPLFQRQLEKYFPKQFNRIVSGPVRSLVFSVLKLKYVN